ncbi:MAG: TrkA family potassium uptake protein [Lachnospiraceae bacterium]|nr:TrkA family potassium uptake protein [Lachnospiraceae bacterium]
MSKRQTYAVFGLGRYGSAVAKELVANGADVIAIDANESIVNNLTSDIPICKCADITDAEVLKQLEISEIDTVIIAMASNLEASVMAIMLCKEAGVKTVIAKCSNETHRKILTKVGADKVVLPESDSGTRLAKNLLSSGFIDVIELSKDVSMLEMEILPEWVGKTILELNLRKKYSINIVAICENSTVSTVVEPEKILTESMKLIVIANNSKLNKLQTKATTN